MITTCILAGCASKPTYNSTSGSGSHRTSGSGGLAIGSQVITDSQGVPNRYQVKQGDTVSKIAQRYGLNWREIGHINNLNSSYTIYTGQWLTLWSGDLKVRERSISSGVNTAHTPCLWRFSQADHQYSSILPYKTHATCCCGKKPHRLRLWFSSQHQLPHQ